MVFVSVVGDIGKINMEPSQQELFLQLVRTADSIGTYGLLIIAIYILYSYVQRLEKFRKESSEKRDKEIDELKIQVANHAKEYKELSQKLLEVVIETKNVMQEVLTQIKK